MGVRTDKVQVEVEINGKKAGESINDLNKSYKQLNRERNQLTVGSDEYIKKSAELKKVKGRLDEVKKEVNGINKANHSAIDSFMQFMPFNGQFQAMKGSLGGVQGKVLGVSKGFGTLRGAIISTGIGALVILIGTLITYLTSTQEGMDKVTAVTRPLAAILQKLKGVAQELGGSVFKGLAQMMNGQLKAGLKTLSEGFSDAGTAAKAAVKDGWEAGTMLDQLQKKIERTEIDLITRRAELNVEYAKSKEIAQDLTKSEEERMAAAKRAQAAQNELLEGEQALMDMKIQKIREEQKLNNTSREEEKELAELIAQRTQFEADAAKKRASAKSLENTIQKEVNAEQEKLLENRRKKEEEVQKALEKKREEMRRTELEADRALQDLKIELMDEGLEKQMAGIQLQFDRKIEAIKGNEAQITEQQALLEQERQEKLQSIQVEWLEKEKERKQAEFEEKLETEAEWDEIEMLRLEEKFALALVAEDEYEEAKYELQREALQLRLDMMREFHGADSIEAQRSATELAQLDDARNKQRVESEGKAQEQLDQIRQAGYQGAKDMVSLGLELLEEEEDGKKKQNKAYRLLASANVAIGLAEELQSIWKNANANPMNALIPGFGTVIAVAQTAAASLRAGKAMGKITTAKYAKGGVFGGSKHSNGGNMVIDSATGQPIAEVEAGEPYMIFSRNTYANNKPVIDQLLYSSMYRNGAPIFETGGIMNPYSSGAAADASAPNASAAIASQAGKSMDVAGTNLDAQILAELRRLNITAQNWPKMLKAFVVLSELQAAQEEDDSVRADAQVK